ncbi:MAG: lamin tail domain-containing protein [Melioribacteraceae bacterium]|nr:lamin tail domain-containing protein [Melioribacteraceae bacterium]
MKKVFTIYLILFISVLGYAQNIKMNEIYSRGTTADPDWIEIYNNSNSEVDISGYKIYDNGGSGGTKPKMEFPSGAKIPAKGFYVIVTDIPTTTNPAGFGLSSTGEKVWLEDKSGAVIDTVTFPAMAEGQSYVRFPNGSAWKLQSPLTKGLSNSFIVMNEIYSRGTTADPDWIEIYNSSDKEVDLTGYKIYDNGGSGGTKPKMEFPSGTKITAKGFYVIVTDIPTTTNPAGFGLSSSGEEVWLENKDGVVIDNYTFGAMTETQSFSRVPDGGNFALVNTITKGKTNGTSSDIKFRDELVTDFKLYQNYPNPFNPETIISYQLPFESKVQLNIYDILGNEVASLVNEIQKGGFYQYTFSMNRFNLSSGVYFYQLRAGNFVQTKKFILAK